MVSFRVVFLFLIFADGFVNKLTVSFSCLENGADADGSVHGKNRRKIKYANFVKSICLLYFIL